MVAARIVSNLFLMSRTPSFRSLLRYEVEAVATSTISILIGVVAFNNAAKKTMGKYPIVATALLLTLIVWVVLCHLRSTFYKKELGIPRRNDFSGLLRVMTIIMSQLLVGALLYSLLSLITSVTIESLAIPTSTSIPEVDILNYWHAVQTGKFKSGPERNVIELNKNLLLAIISNVLMTRFLKHRYDMNKLDSILDPIRP
ncbi:uncharacterized protein LOC110841858 [Folsomia candida]|uniref:uncharacterized protein LOC110841858 n=1 Tax=Folsomia candida TaxID=158441 RepID=UPI000B8F7E1B|nr:uncharacterized protein LOC110841858 [Folsomia candida]